MIGRLFDRVVVYGSRKKDGRRSVEYKAYSLLQSDSSKLCVVLPPWHIAPGLWKKLQNRLLNQGYSLVVVEAAENILVPDGEQILHNFRKVRKLAFDEIAKIRTLQRFESIDVVGLSLGSVSALYLAVSGLEIHKMVLLSPSDDLGEGIWYGKRTSHLRKKLEQSGISLQKFQDLLGELTMRRVHTVKVKEAYIYLSKDDEVIPYRLGLKLCNRLKELGVSVQASDSRWHGHYLSFILFCLRGRV